MSKRVAIFGATGRTGKHLVQQVIDRDMIPVCLVRDKSRVIKVSGEKPVVVIGSPLEYQDVQTTIDGCDYILVALNISRKSDWPWSKVVSPGYLLDKSMKNIVQAMKERKLRRVITVSAWGAGESYQEVNWLFRFLINKTNVGIAYAGHKDQERVLRQSELDWTSVRPVGLNNNDQHREILVRINKEDPLKMTISRKDVAKFMLDILDNKQYFCNYPAISNK